MAEALDPLTKELVGIAAAIAGQCQPCFSYHYKEALKLSASMAAIQAAIELACAVRQAGERHMDEFANRRMTDATTESVQQTKSTGEKA